MLYDPRWEKPEVKADPFTLVALIAWLETMPRNKKYCWAQMSGCLLAQWAQSIDHNASPAGQTGKAFEYIINGKVHDLNRFGVIACCYEITDTFGAALDRARAANAVL